jgi:hypothetical protein
MDKPDLTGFAALLGESLSSRVGMLGQLLRNAHYPSIGQYKERLLAAAIRDYLPNTVEVGTGFVLFPRTEDEPRANSPYYDPLNQSAYVVSKQCDILIFDVARFPPIFRDGDFVVVRPEAVRAVIEVKGALSVRETRTALESFHDFGVKWRSAQQFYAAHHQPTTEKPGLFILAWDFQRDRRGRAATDPTRLRKQIAEFYANTLDVNDADGYPFLMKLLVHQECEIGSIFGMEDQADGGSRFGMHTSDGRFTRIDENDQPFRDRVRTIASLLASLHYLVAKDEFNRFFSYVDEVRGQDLLDFAHEGIEWAYRGLSNEQARHLTSPGLVKD